MTQAEEAKADAEKALALEAAKEQAIAELSEAGVKSDFFLNRIREGKTIEGVEALKDELIKSHIDSSTPEEKPEVPEETPELPEETPEEPEDTPEEPETPIGYDTEDEAKKAAEKALENDDINKSYKVSKGADGKYYYVLSPNPAEEPAEKPEEPIKGVEVGFDTRKEAEDAAQKALENDDINKSYRVSKGADGKYYYVLSPNPVEDPVEKPEKPAEKPTEKESESEKDTKEEAKKEETKEEKSQEEKSEKLPETGEVSSTAIFSAAALSILVGLGLVAPVTKKED